MTNAHIVKHLIRVDDTLDLFAEHAIGGVVGLLANGFFATSAVNSLVAASVPSHLSLTLGRPAAAATHSVDAHFLRSSAAPISFAISDTPDPPTPTTAAHPPAADTRFLG